MRILVTGGKGQLGTELSRLGEGSGHALHCPGSRELDITDPEAIQRALPDTGAELVVNAAAYTAVDRAETDGAAAWAVNAEGPLRLAEACEERNIPLVHISTDYVFDGLKSGPYLETDPVNPAGAYGRSKAAGEAHVRETCRRHLIIRTAWLYGTGGGNFVKTMLRLGGEREEVSVVADQRGCPTHAADLAAAILTIADRISAGEGEPHWGTCHYCGGGSTSWHGFAERIFALAGRYAELKVRRVSPIPTEAYPTPAARPKNSVMDCSRMARWFGIVPPPWEESLAEMIRRLYKGE